MPRPARQPSVAPLLLWPQSREVDALERERAELMARMSALPAHSHRRIVMQARLQDLTLRALRASVALRSAVQ